MVSGTQTSNDPLNGVGPEIRVTRKWRLTFESGRCGYVKEVTDFEKPTFEALAAAGNVGGRDQNGWHIFSIRTRQWGYWGPDACGNYYVDRVMKIGPENKIAEGADMLNSSLFGPKDVGPNAPRNIIFWSLGRFFSNNITEVTEAKDSGVGYIAVSANGKRSEGLHGRWELEIDPAAAWMVRKARFYSERKPQSVNCEVRNQGTAWSGVYCVPERAVCCYLGPIEGADERSDEVTFDPAVENFNEKLYADARSAVIEKRPPKLTIHDYRLSPPLVFTPDEVREAATRSASRRVSKISPTERPSNNTEREPDSATSTSSRRPWYLMPLGWALALLAVVVVLGWWLVRRIRRG
jgi:hypothetical protein